VIAIDLIYGKQYNIDKKYFFLPEMRCQIIGS